MRIQIRESAADIGVLLTTLRGAHAPKRSSVITSAAVALIALAWVPSLVQQTLESPQAKDRVFGVAMVVFVVLFAFWIVLQSLARYEVSDDGITKKSPFGLLSWTVPRGEIYEMALEQSHGWSLVVTTTSSKKRALPMEGSLRLALAKLYPEIAPYQATPRDIRRWKVLGALLGIVVVAVVVMLWWLARAGLVSW